MPHKEGKLCTCEDEILGRVLSIQSHVVHGYVGNRVAVLSLQLLGFEVDFINSVQFSNHTGYKSFKGERLTGGQLEDLISGLEANNLLHHTHLLTGYIGDLTFLKTIIKLVQKLRKNNPNLVYVCDPVMGDFIESNSQRKDEKRPVKMYVPKELADVYKNEVIRLATVLTPNQFEAEILTGITIHSYEDAIRACDALHNEGVNTVCITSLHLNDHTISSLASTIQDGEKRRYKVEVKKLEGTYTGTGDLFSALLLAYMQIFPNDFKLALEKTVSGVQIALSKTKPSAELGKEIQEGIVVCKAKEM